MIPNRVKQVFVNARIPLMLGLSALSYRVMGSVFLSPMRHIFNETAMQARTRASKRLAKKQSELVMVHERSFKLRQRKE